MSLQERVLDECEKRAFSKKHFPDYTTVSTKVWTNMEEYQMVYEINPLDSPGTTITIHRFVPEESIAWKLAAVALKLHGTFDLQPPKKTPKKSIKAGEH